MEHETRLGHVIILNGTPRSGKSSIAAAIQDASNELWMNLGADRYIRITPEEYRPGVGLRPAGIEQMEEKPFALRKKIEPLVPVMYAAMYDSIAAHSRQGLNVVTDVGHHDDYARPQGILYDCARRMEGLPVLFVGVRCPVEIVWERRRNTWLKEQKIPDDTPPPDSVHQWNREVHRPGIYDLEIDTSTMSPEACGQEILKHLKQGPQPTAFKRLAAMSARDRK
ncbi:MAG: chloramphenicol phosphotransferase [Candidatus Latescibacteria bacterium]|nr:chloramphenicol phosphotransferase [Candidatus Latescibacterota bacterium]